MAEKTVTMEKTLQKLLEEKKYPAVRDVLVTMNAADVAYILDKTEPEVTPRLFRLLPKDLAAASFAERLPAELLPAPASTPLGAAPYPAFSTACIMVSAEAEPSTARVLVRRLTLQLVTPSSLETAFSTRAWQAAQLIPVTVY